MKVKTHPLVAHWNAASQVVRMGCACAVCLTTTIWADEPVEPTPQERQQHLQRMRGVAESLRVFETVGASRQEVQLQAEPALRYTDITRRQYDSTVWLWGSTGRPRAVLAVEFYPKHPRGPQWLFELVSLADTKIAASRQDWSWNAKKPGVVLQPLPDGPAVNDKPAARLSQFKQLQRRFSGYEQTVVEGRVELRAMANPLTRYSDPANGIVDGVVFAFANGTNPEILLLIEARRDAAGNADWHFGMAQMAGAEVFGLLDQVEVWKQPNADPVAVRDNYVNGWIPVEGAASAEAAPLKR